MINLFRILIYGLLVLFSVQTIFAQKTSIDRVEPPNWWIGMENTKLQLLVYGKNIGNAKPSINYDGVTINSITTLESENYLFLDLTISRETEQGVFDIVFSAIKGEKLIYKYNLELKKERLNSTQTIDASDVIYLITPDRFANGDTNNDSTDATIEKVNRLNPNGRHGGDLIGITNNLNYLQELGITTLWLNPFLENDQPEFSYHGYAISDFYKTDSRYGTNQDYKRLVDKSHERGMKVIMDQVFNHSGSGHWWLQDLPSKNWVNQWDTFTRSSFTNITASDPHASKSDYDKYIKGWFDTNMPDLNQENEYLATYLIQNSIWWVENFGIDGIRMDTYPYPNKNVMSLWMKTVRKEYPNFYLVAETWEKKASSLSYWNKKEVNNDGYISNVNSVSDYPLYYSMLEAFQKDGDIYKIFETLAEDFVYSDAANNKIFNGNHDVARLFTLLNEDAEKLKLSVAFILTTRGIPQLYYGDELLFIGDKPDGQLRKDFPGGWESDIRNAFTENGRTPEENNAYNYVSSILNWRKNAVEIHKGKLTHYQPNNNIYVYFRHTKTESTLVIINNSDENITNYKLKRFKESLEGYSSGKDIITGKNYSSLETINLQANSALIIKLN